MQLEFTLLLDTETIHVCRRAIELGRWKKLGGTTSLSERGQIWQIEFDVSIERTKDTVKIFLKALNLKMTQGNFRIKFHGEAARSSHIDPDASRAAVGEKVKVGFAQKVSILWQASNGDTNSEGVRVSDFDICRQDPRLMLSRIQKMDRFCNTD